MDFGEFSLSTIHLILIRIIAKISNSNGTGKPSTKRKRKDLYIRRFIHELRQQSTFLTCFFSFAEFNPKVYVFPWCQELVWISITSTIFLYQFYYFSLLHVLHLRLHLSIEMSRHNIFIHHFANDCFRANRWWSSENGANTWLVFIRHSTFKQDEYINCVEFQETLYSHWMHRKFQTKKNKMNEMCPDCNQLMFRGTSNPTIVDINGFINMSRTSR